MHQAAFAAIGAWSRVRHPSIVRIREAFTTRAFNDNCLLDSICMSTVLMLSYSIALVVSYDYHPNSQTLFDAHLRPKQAAFSQSRFGGASNVVIPEATLWSYIIQIAGAIRVTHEAGLAVRMVDPTKILLTGQNRYVPNPFMHSPICRQRHISLRINSCGVVDVLMYDTRQDVALVQQEDLVMFGRLIFGLCCGNAAAMNTLPKALDVMGRMYSADVRTLALFLISKPGPHKVSEYFSRGGDLIPMTDRAVGAEYCASH